MMGVMARERGGQLFATDERFVNVPLGFFSPPILHPGSVLTTA